MVSRLQKEDFDRLPQLEKIEFLLRKQEVQKNISSSFPNLEIAGMLLVFLFSRLYTLSIIAAFGLTTQAIASVNLLNAIFNTLFVILMISFIARVTMYFQKKRQITLLHEEFLNKNKITRILKEIPNKNGKKDERTKRQ